MKPIETYTIDELEEGLEATIERLLTVEDIQNFANLTQDFHPLHTSVVYAKANGFEDIIAHGLLLSSFSSGIIGMKLPGENAIIMSQTFTYKNPVYPGTQLLIKGVIDKRDTRFSLLEIKIKITSIDNSQVFATGKYSVKVREKIIN
jgi:3-hydroxybutyryl-CoA dehydratase